MSIEHLSIIKILFLLSFSSVLAFLWTPLLTKFLYRYRLWRKNTRTKSIDGKPSPVFYKLNKKREVGVPRFGGLIIWLTTIFVAFLFSFLAHIFGGPIFNHLNFLSRKETWLPLAILAASSFLGLADDITQVFNKGKYTDGGIKFARRLFFILLIGGISAWWFYFKLDWNIIYVPFIGNIRIGGWYIPLFIITMLASWSGGVIDGIDGLAGGTLAIIFSAFTVISFSLGFYNLSAFCAVLSGAILAFLWFNIPPARFYMGETGMMGLTATLTAVSFLTNSVIVLPIIGGLLVIESGSVIIQLLSKKIRKKKVFIAAPIHHHLEAKGWPPEKITMRFWILGMILAIIGVAVRLL